MSVQFNPLCPESKSWASDRTTAHGIGEAVIGSCSCCGGDVVRVVGPWFGIPPPPRCTKCGAGPSRSAMPVVPMQPRDEADRPTDTEWIPFVGLVSK